MVIAAALSPSSAVESGVQSLLDGLVGVLADGADSVRHRSTFEQVGPLLLRSYCGDAAALAPSPTVNGALSGLVSVVVDPAHGSEVVRQVCAHLDRTPRFRRRARAIKQAAARAEFALERQVARDTLANSTGAPTPGGTDRTTLEAALVGFPYCANYEHLVAAEVGAVRIIGRTGPTAFCGAGPLPLTGILWHRHTGEPVTLVDVDPVAADLARAVVGRLSDHGLVPAGAIQIVEADAAHLDPSQFDVVVVASLIPNPTVLRLARRLVASGRRPLLAVRSAVGLTARLAYDPIDVELLTNLGLRHRGSVVPRQVLADSASPGISIHRDDPTILQVAPFGVLNTTEVFD